MKWLLVVLVGVVSFSCNSINDIQPPDADSVLIKATQAIKNRYPQATDIQFNTLVTDQLWQATFKQQSTAYQTQVNATGIVTVVLKKLDNNFTPYQSLTDQLSIRGGSYSDLWAVDADTSSTKIMTYFLRGITYRLTYREDKTKEPVISLNPLPLYSVTSLSELPQRIRTFFSTQSNTVRFQSGQVIRLTGGKLTYWLTASYTSASSTTTIPLIFDEVGNLNWVGYNASNAPIVYKPNSEVGDASLLATISANYPQFDQSSNQAFETYNDGLVSVRYVFQRAATTTITENWEVGAQWPTGQVAYAIYQTN